MVNITLPDHLAAQLEEIAQREKRSVTDIVVSMIEQYEPKPVSQEESDTAFDSIFGIYDDDVTDMSTSVRETLKDYFEKKYGRPD
jgi:metal-responsive CopG/Arc/MetJ family transcriptional regulator